MKELTQLRSTSQPVQVYLVRCHCSPLLVGTDTRALSNLFKMRESLDSRNCMQAECRSNGVVQSLLLSVGSW